MDIIGKLRLQKFWQKHKQEHKRARKPLESWIQTTEKAEWHNFAQTKRTFRRCDVVRVHDRGFVVFDIGGNKYRLVTAINYQKQIVVIDFALTHPEYDQGKWKDLI